MELRPRLLPLLFLIIGFTNKSSSQELQKSVDLLWLYNKSPDSGKVAEVNYLNFHAPLDFSATEFVPSYRTKATKSYSFFLVMRSKEADEKNILTIKNNNSSVFVTTQLLKAHEENKFHIGEPSNGIIVNYNAYKNSIKGRRKGRVTFDNSLFEPKASSNIYELIYFPTNVTAQKRMSIESYLSLKYGVSLEKYNYLNSAGDTIREYKSNADFDYRVTGIGRDDASGLYQKQSRNAENDGLTIAAIEIVSENHLNPTIFNDNTFLIWGDNGKSTTLGPDKKNSTIKKMARIWKAVSPNERRQDSLTFTILADDKLIPPAKPEDPADLEEVLWLSIDTLNLQYSDFDSYYIKATKTGKDSLQFSNVPLLCKNAFFTFVKAPELFVLDEVTAPDCTESEKGSASLKIVGGIAPYEVRIYRSGFEKTFTSEGGLNFNDADPGEYFYEVVDAKGRKFSAAFNVEDWSTNGDITIDPTWILDGNNSVHISPTVTEDKNIIRYEWFDDGKLAGQGKTFNARKPGHYILRVTGVNHCTKDLPFEVKPLVPKFYNEWILSPNPATPGENFNITFDFETGTEVMVQVYDIQGKLLRSVDLGTITKAKHADSLNVAGTYLIVCVINGEKQSATLIVK